MRVIKRVWSSTLFFLLLAAAAHLTAAPWPELTREREIDLALSAAPDHLRDGATVYVLGENGHEEARRGSNGFSCIVQRVRGVLGPVCYDAEGSRTTLRADLRRSALLAQGKSDDEVDAILRAEYEAGALEAPQRPGIAYMLSPEFVRIDSESGEAKRVFPPHLMFYAPYMSNDDIGASSEHNGSRDHPWVLNPGQASSYIIIVPPDVPADNRHDGSGGAGDAQ